MLRGGRNRLSARRIRQRKNRLARQRSYTKDEPPARESAATAEPEVEEDSAPLEMEQPVPPAPPAVDAADGAVGLYDKPQIIVAVDDTAEPAVGGTDEEADDQEDEEGEQEEEEDEEEAEVEEEEAVQDKVDLSTRPPRPVVVNHGEDETKQRHTTTGTAARRAPQAPSPHTDAVEDAMEVKESVRDSERVEAEVAAPAPAKSRGRRASSDAGARMMSRSTSRVIPMEEVMRHNTAESCWITANGRVFDVTPFMARHPGGAKVLMRRAGQDASEDLDMHSKGARKLWDTYQIGVLAGYDSSNCVIC